MVTKKLAGALGFWILMVNSANPAARAATMRLPFDNTITHRLVVKQPQFVLAKHNIRIMGENINGHITVSNKFMVEYRPKNKKATTYYPTVRHLLHEMNENNIKFSAIHFSEIIIKISDNYDDSIAHATIANIIQKITNAQSGTLIFKE